MEKFWIDLNKKNGKADILLRKKIGKALYLLSSNPLHPGLNSHEIEVLSHECGVRIFESYIENKTPSARRLFWMYGPNRQEITVIAVQPHPNDKNNAYKSIKLL
ncbi:MAG: hypothetical protein MJ214_01065 [Bacilli bacterium]|nr:hypothetical protein [Bacilli bacterium]